MTREQVDELCNALVQNGNIVKAKLFSEHDAEQRAEIEALKAQLAKSFNKKRFENEPPCYLCGYNGPDYFQPDTHPCARFHHEKRRSAR